MGLPLTRSGAEWNRVHDAVAAARLAPSRAWDALLWASCAALIVVAAWTLGQRLLDALRAAG